MTLQEEITEEEVKESIKKPPNGKTPGLDVIPFELYKMVKDQIAQTLTKTFNKVKTGEYMEDFNIANIVLLYKMKGDKTNPKYWRPITLANTDGKIMSRIISNRFSNILKRVLCKNQYGLLRKEKYGITH
ncbi:hypothetical protein CONCODRAFT_10027 [Conidiobolus coronatus NRRL 28638]|uniref:Reverse transcriptase domain-containing protein n=1 Tax=Conidiobolus coronatus (strain ATCC 28846 / CBS 209.66 / NRRL 28638) TaxID=796925 RepID=A0A137NYX9_CONC2|nr:hypothetical protein CONCODRAFT_10027 [Conidiobolus coronatus NRRL 28638]|eukprot:KXN67844.1 hypothetical protein CONCODRAFT_10027 [Conidiobolus coronatus NRRL 28638]